MASNVRLDEVNLLVAVRSPGLTGASPASSTYGEEWRSTPRNPRRRGGRPRSGLRDAPTHRERVGAVGEVRGWTKRPETSPERDGRRIESATLWLIGGLPFQFLARGGPGRQGGSPDGVGAARGSRRRWHDGGCCGGFSPFREEDERKGKTMVVAAARGGTWVRVFYVISMGIKERGKWSTSLRWGG
jgi:hypothetical protein